MEIITQTMIKNAKGGEPVNGVLLIKGYAVAKTKTNKDYISGQAQSGMVVPFKAWGSSAAFTSLRDSDYCNMPCYITGSFDDFGGSISIVIDTVQAVSDFQPSQFLEVKYDKQSYAIALKQICQQNISESGYSLLNTMLFNNTELFERFTEEFAAMNHHDNCKSGLLVHTYKLCCILTWVCGTYPKLLVDESGKPSSNRKDLLFIGAVLHDIGKVKEMNYGVYQPESAVGHQILGLDLLYEYKTKIEAVFGTKWFRDLQAILVEHHGEYESPYHTTPAYIIHQLDCLDARFTGLCQEIDERMAIDNTGCKVKVDGKYLTI